jgi:hypothetical protein
MQQEPSESQKAANPSADINGKTPVDVAINGEIIYQQTKNAEIPLQIHETVTVSYTNDAPTMNWKPF